MSSKSLAVEVKSLSKRYLISHQEKHRYLGDALLAKLKNPFAKPVKEEFWALKDVSFDVNAGEVLGIIGRNGAGKSTMLKILSGITEPTSGEIRMHGKVGALLEVGTGFHPELTGRENVFLNGTILGMRKREVAKRFDEIVDFAEVERFIDTPVKRYSSGMYVRLAFAIAANLDPEILIVDEVLAVGDAKFQAKCLGKMKDIAGGEGRTVLFVSHSEAAVRQLCTKAVLLKDGQVQYFGDVDGAMRLYNDVPEVVGNRIIERVKTFSPGIELDRITVNGSESTEVELSPTERELDIVISGRALTQTTGRLGLAIKDANRQTLASFGEGLLEGVKPVVEAGPFEWRAHIEIPSEVTAGEYILGIEIADPGVHAWVALDYAAQIRINRLLTPGGTQVQFADHYGFVLLDGEVERFSGQRSEDAALSR